MDQMRTMQKLQCNEHLVNYESLVNRFKDALPTLLATLPQHRVQISLHVLE